MTIVEFFDDYLAKLIEKKPIAFKGLIRLAVKEKFSKKTPEDLDYPELREIFNTTLKKRLENIKIPNISKIVSEMISYLINNQSLLTMTMV